MTNDRNTCLIKSKVEGKMYPLDVSLIIGKPQLCFLSKAVSEVSWLWHHKLTHLNFIYINNLVTEELVCGLPILKYNNDTLCPAYECGRQTKCSHPMIVDKKYIMFIVNDFTRFTWVFFLMTPIRYTADHGQHH